MNRKTNFFVRKSDKFQKRNKKQVEGKSKKSRVEDDVSSDSEEEVNVNGKLRNKFTAKDDSDAEETAQEKKLRLAKKYLQEIEQQEKDRLDKDEVPDDVIDQQLRNKVLEKSGQLFRKVADEYLIPDEDDVKFLRNGHRLAVTCVCVSSDSQFIYSGSKDCSLIKWCLKSGKKLKCIPGGRKGTEDKHVGHTACINCLALSSDDKFLVSGCDNNKINVWDCDMNLLKTFSGHKGAVTGLAFRRGTHTLYSCSSDRSVKVWSIDELSYVETLFGHQEPITAIDSLSKERAITSGGRDTTVRVWKIVEESQLIFHGHQGSIDCVKLIDEQHFVSGGDDGSISLWSLSKKKPMATVLNAHSSTPSGPNWITSLSSMVNTDLFVTGSNNGEVCFWKCVDFKKIERLFKLPIVGFVNCLQLSTNGDYLIAAVGQEHRLGRWWRFKEAKNAVVVIPLQKRI